MSNSPVMPMNNPPTGSSVDSSDDSTTTAAPKNIRGGLKKASIISGVLGFLLFVLTPFLPVQQVQSSFDWPQQSLNSVNAPLISYAPESLSIDLPLSAMDALNPQQSLLVGTLPQDSDESTARGLYVRSDAGELTITVRNKVLLSLSADEIRALPDDAVLSIVSEESGTTARIDGTAISETVDDDIRPMLTGIYSEIADTPENAEALTHAGLSAHVEINSRFTSLPSLWKYIAMWGGLAATLVALFCLWKLDKHTDRLHTPSPARIPATHTKSDTRPRRLWSRLVGVDCVVIVLMLFWYIFGANTSDDGFLMTMSRISHHGTYMANYYRWLGVPESPFGAPYYDLLGLMSYVSTASIWMRLPQLLAGITTWLMLSHAVIPRLTGRKRNRRVAYWTAAFVFLAYWTAYNNGLRPEPVIALGSVMTWVLFERAIARRHLLPAALGLIIATITLGAGPSGLMAVAGFLVSLPALIRIVDKHVGLAGGGFGGWMTFLSPFLACGTAILVGVFGDQTLANVIESTRVRAALGPSLHWYDEWVRYQTLLQQTVDGSLARRFAVLITLFCVILALASILRNHKIPGTEAAPTQRLILMYFGSLFFMMFTPTKWTHHFGVHAGIGAAICVLGALAVSHAALRSVRIRIFFAGAVLMLVAFTFSGQNGWWYVSSYRIPWYDKSPQFHAIEFSTIILVLGLLVLFVGIIGAFITDFRRSRGTSPSLSSSHHRFAALRTSRFGHFTGTSLAASPIAIAAALVVALSVLSFAKAFASQYPSYTIGMGNIRELAGDTGQLARDVLIESNSNDSFLTPADGSPLGESLDTASNIGFSSTKVPTRIDASGIDTSGDGKGSISGAIDEDTTTSASAGQSTGTAGGYRADAGINGSHAHLPFNLDFATIPVIGSWDENQQNTATATTSWFTLPERSEDTPLVVVTAAGSIEHHDINGVKVDGQKLVLEYGTLRADGSVDTLGELEPIDIGPDPAWRNLRFPMDTIPENATVVRVKATDESLDPDQWLAFLPPRVPTLVSLNDAIPEDEPGLLDWAVALQFPNQRSFDHYAGVDEIPTYRISPDYPGKVTLSPFQDYRGGGAMGPAEAVNTSWEVPSYLKNDWGRDWGSLQRYELRVNSQGVAPDVAHIDTEVITRSGWWSPSHMPLPA